MSWITKKTPLKFKYCYAFFILALVIKLSDEELEQMHGAQISMVAGAVLELLFDTL
jgi:hypothetical protein